MKKNWNIIVGALDCQNHYMDEGYLYCTVEDGPKYCNESDCPIKEPLNKEVEHEQTNGIENFSGCKVVKAPRIGIIITSDTPVG